MKNFKTLTRHNLLILAIMFVSMCSFSQDIHFSHIHSSPTYLNPAYTGIFNGTVRVILNYKNQWNSIGKYNTGGLSTDFKVVNLRNRDFLSMGVGFYFDNAGDLSYRTFYGTYSIAYTKSLSDRRSHGITLGLYAAALNLSYDLSKGKAFDFEPIYGGVKNSTFNFSAGAGLSWFCQIKRYSSIYAGFGVNHMNMPNISTRESKVKLPMKMVFNIGGIYASKSRNALLPSVMYTQQGKQHEVLMGTFYRLEVNNNWKEQGTYFYLGAWIRWFSVPKSFSGMDALIASLRYDVKDWKFTFSYDLNLSRLSSASRGRGGPELSIIYSHQSKAKHGNKELYCPRF